MHSAVNFVLTLILRLVAIVLAVLSAIETGLRHVLASAGIHGELQAGILILAAFVFIIAALRLLGGVFGVLITIFLLLLILNILMPGFHLPASSHV